MEDLYPKHIINSKGEKKEFDESKIASVLNKETGLDMKIAESVAEDVLRKVIGLGNDEIKTTHLREIVCLELTKRGLNKYRNLFARAINLEDISFKLDEDFLESYKRKQPDWGPLGYFTYKRTYARLIYEEDRKEEFWETLRRVVEGCYSIQKEHCKKLSLPWDKEKAQRSAQKMWEKIWHFKMTPPGRGFWIMGTEHVNKHGSMALNNCGFASTADIDLKYTKAFEFVMDALMLGVGVGFDTKGAGKITIKQPQEGYFEFIIPDSREGWVEALKLILEAYFLGHKIPEYDYSKIRPAGQLIRGFGGVASGPEPLKEMLRDMQGILNPRIGEPITSVDIVDLMNLIGKCVIAGNVRRSAEIALGDPTDLDFVTCKQDKEKLYSHRWASNNSVFARKGLDYSFISDQIAINGEPGILWLENARAYSRMRDKPDYKDKKAAGVNPCVTSDTLIAVADGRNAVPIKVLAEEDKDVPVYCKDTTGRTVIRMMRNPRITGKDKGIYRVTLDDGSVIKCTGNHTFFLRNMEKREAKDLKVGDGLIITSKWQVTWAEIMGEEKKRKSEYWMLNDGQKNIFEHTLIYEQLADTNLQKITFEDCTYAIKVCEACGKEFKVKWGKREQAYCSYNCSNKKAAVKAGKALKRRAKKRPSEILSKMFAIFEEYIQKHNKVPTKSEFITALNQYNINHLRTAGLLDSYQKFLNLITQRYKYDAISSRKLNYDHYNLEHTSMLKENGLCYNHKVVSIEKIGNQIVYNGTVDEFHNYGIILNKKKTKSQRTKLEMVFTANCGEQTLESFELCCLAETFPSRHDSYKEYQETLKYAYLYAKSVTLVNTHWQETNAVMLKNRRMGISQTGIIEAFVKHGRRNMLEWSDKGYEYLKGVDERYSNWLCIPQSIKLTTVKPSGTVSILAGVSSGIHYPHSEYYIRRVRVSSNSDLIELLKQANYRIEEDKYSNNTMVIEFPYHCENFQRGKEDVSIWEQAENAASYQKYWSDNQVSITITFKPEEAKEIKHVLECFEDKLKAVSFLPIKEHGYEQAPYEEITKEEYEKRMAELKPLKLSETIDEAIGEKFCDSDTCQVDYIYDQDD